MNAIRADLILAMMVTLSSNELLSTDPRCMNSGTAGAAPSHLDGRDRIVGQKLTEIKDDQSGLQQSCLQYAVTSST